MTSCSSLALNIPHQAAPPGELRPCFLYSAQPVGCGGSIVQEEEEKRGGKGRKRKEEDSQIKITACSYSTEKIKNSDSQKGNATDSVV